MARAKSTAAANLLEYENEWRKDYSGTKNQLIAAGLALDGDFPGDPANGRVTANTFERDGRRISIRVRSRMASPLTYWLSIQPTVADERRRHAEKAEEVAEQESQCDRSTRELLARREAFDAEVRRAIAAGEDIGIMQRDETCLTEWVGTRTALVAEGLCTPDQFPDGRKRMKHGETNGRYWTTTKLARGHVAYCLRVTEEERSRRWHERHAAECEAEARGPEGVYGSVEAYAEMAESQARLLKLTLLDILSGADECREFGSVTLMYDKDTIRRAESLCEQIVQTVQAGFASWTRGERAVQRKAEAARADPRFVRFLQQARGEHARRAGR